jgi:hypothetical protein
MKNQMNQNRKNRKPTIHRTSEYEQLLRNISSLIEEARKVGTPFPKSQTSAGRFKTNHE